MIKQGRNEPCSCGSGKKYKQCCGATGKPQTISPQILADGLRAAWVNFEASRLAQASLICQQIIKFIPAQIDALYLQGLIALKDGQIERAVELLSNVVKRDANKAPFIASLGFAYHEQGKMDLAIKSYRKAIALDPKNINAHYNLHAALIGLPNIDEAIANLETVNKLSAHDHDAIFMLGMLNDTQNKLEIAETYFTQLKHASPIIKSRLDAWDYLKTNAKPLPPVTGSIVDTFKICMGAAKLEGLVLEFGVRHGNSIRQLAILAKQNVHGFDSFEGIPEDWHDEAMGSYSTKGIIPKVPENVMLHQGWFDQTLPEFLSQYKEPIRLINIDCDIYSSTKSVLDLLAPRIESGAVIIFDEYIGNQHWCEDEFKAFQEAAKSYDWKYEYLCFSFFTKQVAVKIL